MPIYTEYGTCLVAKTLCLWHVFVVAEVQDDSRLTVTGHHAYIHRKTTSKEVTTCHSIPSSKACRILEI